VFNAPKTAINDLCVVEKIGKAGEVPVEPISVSIQPFSMFNINI
jgi:hypothetical protein